MRFSICIEMLFVNEAGDPAERIRLAAKAGYRFVEFWQWSNKDLGSIGAACRSTGVEVGAILAEPKTGLVDPAKHEAFFEGLRASIDAARRVGAPVLIAQAGYADASARRNESRSALLDGLKKSADILRGTGVTLAVEPLNTRVDHAGYFLSSNAEGLDIIDEVGKPEIQMLYDVYHSMVMDEHPPTVIGDRIDRIIHVHVADHPGRHEPGSGNMQLGRTLAMLEAKGYGGLVGFEFRPTGASVDALERARESLGL